MGNAWRVARVTDPFARFEVKHLSATSMLQFRADPALGILYLVYGIREAGSPAMHRGSALDHCYPVVSEWSAPLAYQHPIRLTLQGIEVPVIGFIDLRYVNVVRELKSSGKPRRGIVDDHAFQVATYAMAIRQETGEWPQAFVDYLMPSGMSSFQLKNGKRWVRAVVDTAASIRTLLDNAQDKDALCASIQPDYSNWLWRYRPNCLAAAKELFGS